MREGDDPVAAACRIAALGDSLTIILMVGPEGVGPVVLRAIEEGVTLPCAWHDLSAEGAELSVGVHGAGRVAWLVHGLDDLAPEARRAAMRRLNQGRDRLRSANAAVVVWVPERDLEDFQRRCGDLFAWRAALLVVGEADVRRLREGPHVVARALIEHEAARPQRVISVPRPAPAWPPILMMHVDPGAFVMGSPLAERGREPNETPHRVKLTRRFEIAVTPITVEQYAAASDQPWWVPLGDPALPVKRVTWFNAVRFCDLLSRREGLEPAYRWDGEGPVVLPDAVGYRLPTEAEWEYACRAGTTSRFWSGDTDADLHRVGWSGLDSNGRVRPVGRKPANPWGLYDMHGNVWEWCDDAWADSTAADVVDPRHRPEKVGAPRVVRGGSAFERPRRLRSAARMPLRPDARRSDVGFRVVRPLAPLEPGAGP